MVALVGGVAAILFIAGGAVLAGRLYSYRLPVEAVVGQLPHDYLLVVGLLEVALPALGTALLYLVIRSVVWRVSQSSRYFLDDLDLGVPLQLLAMGLLSAALFALGRDVLSSNLSTPWDALHVLAAFGVGAICGLVGWGVAYVLGAKAEDGISERRSWLDLRIAASVAIGLVPLWVYNGASAPLSIGVVCAKVTQSGAAVVPTPSPGYLIGGTDRIYFGYPVTAGPAPRYVASVPLEGGTLLVWSVAQSPSRQPVCPLQASIPNPSP